MGACNSHSAIAVANYQLPRSSSTPTATVISHSGDLRRCKLPATAVQVLQSEPPETFICNSDALIYEEFVPTLNPNEELLPDNLYFVLPNSKLRHRLNASDMAALAIRASLALQKSNEKMTSVSPVNGHYSRVSVHRDNGVTVGSSGLRKTKIPECNNDNNNTSGQISNNHVTVSRTGSVRKFQRMPSKRVKVAVRSARMRRLSTIYEVSEP